MKKQNIVVARACAFDWSQLDGWTVNAELVAVEAVAREKNTISNYRIVFKVAGVDTAIVRYELWTLGRDGNAYGWKKPALAMLSALGLAKLQEQNGFYTGYIEVDIDELRRSIGKTVEVTATQLDGQNKGKAYKWVSLTPTDSKALDVLLSVVQQGWRSKDVMDSDDNLVSFDSLRDNELDGNYEEDR